MSQVDEPKGEIDGHKIIETHSGDNNFGIFTVKDGDKEKTLPVINGHLIEEIDKIAIHIKNPNQVKIIDGKIYGIVYDEWGPIPVLESHAIIEIPGHEIPKIEEDMLVDYKDKKLWIKATPKWLKFSYEDIQNLKNAQSVEVEEATEEIAEETSDATGDVVTQPLPVKPEATPRPEASGETAEEKEERELIEEVLKYAGINSMIARHPNGYTNVSNGRNNEEVRGNTVLHIANDIFGLNPNNPDTFPGIAFAERGLERVSEHRQVTEKKPAGFFKGGFLGRTEQRTTTKEFFRYVPITHSDIVTRGNNEPAYIVAYMGTNSVDGRRAKAVVTIDLPKSVALRLYAYIDKKPDFAPILLDELMTKGGCDVSEQEWFEGSRGIGPMRFKYEDGMRYLVIPPTEIKPYEGRYPSHLFTTLKLRKPRPKAETMEIPAEATPRTGEEDFLSRLENAAPDRSISPLSPEVAAVQQRRENALKATRAKGTVASTENYGRQLDEDSAYNKLKEIIAERNAVGDETLRLDCSGVDLYASMFDVISGFKGNTINLTIKDSTYDHAIHFLLLHFQGKEINIKVEGTMSEDKLSAITKEAKRIFKGKLTINGEVAKEAEVDIVPSPAVDALDQSAPETTPPPTAEPATTLPENTPPLSALEPSQPKSSEEPTNLSRRKFLKQAGAATAGAIVAGVIAQKTLFSESSEEQTNDKFPDIKAGTEIAPKTIQEAVEKGYMTQTNAGKIILDTTHFEWKDKENPIDKNNPSTFVIIKKDLHKSK